MATQLLSLPPNNSNDTNYRAWGKGISDALTAFGLNKTADTGQADWINAVVPTASTYPQYEIRAFVDSLSATAPVVFKIEYGGQANNFPALRFTLGTGSNGSGTITSPVSNTALTGVVVNLSGSGGSTPQTCALSGANNRFALAFSFSNNLGFYASLERTTDDQGNSTSEGILFTASNSSGLANYYWNFGNPPVTEASGIVTPTASAVGNVSGADGTQINIYPNFFYRGGSPVVGLNTVGIFNGDIQGTNPTNFVVLGATHAYYFLGGTGTSNYLNKVARGSLVGTGIGMRWE